MRAAVLRGPGDLRLEKVAIPDVGPGEVLVKVMVTGVCGSDLARLSGAAHTYPIVLGHEFSGVIEQVGPGVHKVRAGDRVVGVPLKPCHQCQDCAKGDFGLCRQYSFVGSRTQGAWAEYVALPEANVLPFDHAISFADAAMVEPASVALHALRHVPSLAGQDVAVIGAGNIGMFVLQWAQILGASRVTVLDVDDVRLESASRLGAAATVHPGSAEAGHTWRELTAGRGYTTVIETAGSPEAMGTAFELAANRSAVVLVGTPVEEVVFGSKQFEQLNRKEISLTGSWMSYSAPFPGDEWALALHHIRTGSLTCGELVHGEYPLQDIAVVLGEFQRGKPLHGKILLYTEHGQSRDEVAQGVHTPEDEAQVGSRR